MKSKVPPPILLLIAGAVMWFVAGSDFAYLILIPFSPAIAAVLTAAGFLIALLALREFKVVDTTVNPQEPESATALVSAGIFGRTRNPMYVGLLLILAGWGVWLGSLSNLVVILLFIVVITELQIKPEEAALEKIFGEDYQRYCERVRRWV